MPRMLGKTRKLPLLTGTVLGCLIVLLTAPRMPAFAAVNRQIIANTPNPDGSIVHYVEENETLASIAEAYGISLYDLRAVNGLSEDATFITVGQRLIIRTALPPSETPTITATIPRPTRTPTLLKPTRTPRPSSTPAPTFTPSPTTNPMVAAATDFYDTNRRPLLLGLLAVCLLGLGWTLWAGFRPSRYR